MMRLLVTEGPDIAGGIIGAGGQLSWPTPTRAGFFVAVPVGFEPTISLERNFFAESVAICGSRSHKFTVAHDQHDPTGTIGEVRP